ncbi:MAG: DUF362 domain-containing protein, partial [Bacillota bacterium]
AVAVLSNDENGKELLKQAIDLCNGFANLKPSDRVLIKPNLVIGGEKYKKMIRGGVVINPTVMANLIELLHEHGCKNIIVGEGSVIQKSMGADTKTAYEYSGIKEILEKEEIPFIDFYDDEQVKVMFGDLEVEVAKSIMEADFVINIPTLKTHSQCTVSLGIKNIKGAIAFESKKDFHKFGLHRLISMLPTKIRNDLTIIDGTFALEKGPVGPFAHPKNVLLASTDLLAIDIVGATLLGYDPAEVEHIKGYAEIVGRSLDMSTVNVVGENPADYVQKLEWYEEMGGAIFGGLQVTGCTAQKGGDTLCSGCGFGASYALFQYFRGHKGQEFDGLEICMGGEVKCRPESKQVYLLGKCAIDLNADRTDAIKVRGCPPPVDKIVEALEKNAQAK